MKKKNEGTKPIEEFETEMRNKVFDDDYQKEYKREVVMENGTVWCFDEDYLDDIICEYEGFIGDIKKQTISDVLQEINKELKRLEVFHNNILERDIKKECKHKIEALLWIRNKIKKMESGE